MNILTPYKYTDIYKNNENYSSNTHKNDILKR